MRQDQAPLPRRTALRRALLAGTFSFVTMVIIALALLVWVVGVDSILAPLGSAALFGVCLGGSAFLVWLLLVGRRPEWPLSRTAVVAVPLTLLLFFIIMLLTALASTVSSLASGSTMGGVGFGVVAFPLIFTLIALPGAVGGAILTVIVRGSTEHRTAPPSHAAPLPEGHTA
ncbi:hypothetical protein [Leucobacter chromiireducens]|uniref:hypothetical protein n=1 Tax=Leucobacter chromiireducens TaxID=283877 RepID=UPI003F81C63D